MTQKMRIEVNSEVYKRIYDLVRFYDSSMEYFPKDLRWGHVKAYVFNVLHPNTNTGTKAGKRMYKEYNWLQELHDNVAYLQYNTFLDVYELVTKAYQRQR